MKNSSDVRPSCNLKDSFNPTKQFSSRSLNLLNPLLKLKIQSKLTESLKKHPDWYKNTLYNNESPYLFPLHKILFLYVERIWHVHLVEKIFWRFSDDFGNLSPKKIQSRLSLWKYNVRWWPPKFICEQIPLKVNFLTVLLKTAVLADF